MMNRHQNCENNENRRPLNYAPVGHQSPNNNTNRDSIRRPATKRFSIVGNNENLSYNHSPAKAIKRTAAVINPLQSSPLKVVNNLQDIDWDEDILNNVSEIEEFKDQAVDWYNDLDLIAPFDDSFNIEDGFQIEHYSPAMIVFQMSSCSILMIAEKPSLAESLAKILSYGRMKTRKGMNNACSVHEFRGPFQKKSNCFFKFTSVCGHVMGVDFAPKYDDWNKTEPIELYDADVIKKEANPNLRIPHFLRNEAKSCDILVLWLDCDREGENICFEVMDALSRVMRLSYSNPQTMFRARFSAIAEKEIFHAFNNLVLPNQLESLCVEARQEIDLRVGCSFTRHQTRFFREKYGDLDSTLISYGPCQTPTFGFCVERHDDILGFEPQPYWIVDVTVKSEGGSTFNLNWQREREFKKSVAIQYLNYVKGFKHAKITKISKTIKSKHGPQALNTVQLLKTASSAYHIGPHQAMQIAERLYTQGFISYPRTETNVYPSSFDLKGALHVLGNHPDLGGYVRELLKWPLARRSGHDAGDHPPITPMRAATSSDFDHDTWRIYDFIARNFIGSVSPDAKYEHLSVSFDIGDEKFSRSGNTVLSLGFTEIMPWAAMENDFNIPNVRQGDTMVIVDAKLTERRTTAPGYLTESDLIGLMEKNGIGTDASIVQHINNICQRAYVKVQPTDRRLIPTQLGIVLVNGYKRIDPELVLPNSRANVEKILNQICTVHRDYKTVLCETISMYKAKFKYFIDNIMLMDELFSVSFTTLAESGKPFSKCGVCKRYMKYVHQRPQRLFCGNCNQTYSLPQNGSIKVFKDDKCPLDNFALLHYSAAGSEKEFVFCPRCFESPPYEDMQKNTPCIGCTDKNCDKAMIKNQVRICTNCTFDGRVVLESWSGPSRWRFVCNKCGHIIYGFKDAKSVKVIEDKNCTKCSAWLVRVQFKEADKKLTGCIFCDGELLGYLGEKSLIKKNQNNNPYNRQGNNTHQNNRSQPNHRASHHNNSKIDSYNELPADNPARGTRDPMGAPRGRESSSRGRSSRGRGSGAPRGRDSSSRGRPSRGRGRGRGGRSNQAHSNHQDGEQFRQLSYADFIQF